MKTKLVFISFIMLSALTIVFGQNKTAAVPVDTERLIVGCMDGVYQLDLRDGQFEKLYEHGNYVSSVGCLGQDTIVSAGYDGALRWYDYAAKKNVRVLSCGPWDDVPVPGLDFKRVNGGLLVQDRDLGQVHETDLRVVTRRAPTEQEARDLRFAWRVAKFVKSNAIVYCRDAMTIGVGAGQMSRVYSARVAALKAADEGLAVKGSVMASDAFFPFRDGIDQAAEAGIVAVIQPGGSMRDEEVIAAADEHGMAMVFTGMRHFRH